MTEALHKAAQAVLDRWDSPQWEWRQHGPTADLMADLRAALAQPPAPTAQPKLPFADVCAMLPADVSWGDPLTPAMAREIAQAAQPVQQPGDNINCKSVQKRLAVQAAPAQRQPLSDEQIDSLTFPFLTAELGPTAYDRAIARAIEAAHNITAAPAAQKGEKL